MSDYKPTHLYFYYPGAYDAGVSGHAQDVMASLGITYFHSTPQTLFDG